MMASTHLAKENRGGVAADWHMAVRNRVRIRRDLNMLVTLH